MSRNGGQDFLSQPFCFLGLPLAFGFLPVGLWYHALYTLAAALLMAALVRWYWPAGLEREK